ncbi:glycine--tRNA ligase subunit beta [Desulfurobacterium atlanticum]|uniref:Glycine--tRNA ligase beta subunit n=1 Tax=Desulfurobacterium atlanticum TaxID=240169 RepID=A0A238ZM24_9BACT|nr:glycine--tRNA ligase subunit beta [Desulfurobacterium atlanticum]SNR84455.1 glycyl-tRNA synthetase beta chain [Desulfurobacterium atlanticum]
MLVKAKNFVLEIGTEELPASFIKPALENLKSQFQNLLKESHLFAEAVEVFGTPRRLILIAEGVPEKEPDREVLVTGPSWKAAFDCDGNPTKAALGFAKSKGVDVSELIKIETEKGIYAGFKKIVKGKDTVSLLKEKLPEIIRKIPFKKSMRWGSGNLRFGRPIRWICCVFGEEKVSFSLDGINSDVISYGHRFLSPEPLDVREVDNFIEELERRFVVADIEKRKAIIFDVAKTLAESVEGVLFEDEELLEEVANLVEYPYPILGSFDRIYLELPEEVPIVVMKEHQRYFSLKDRNGKLKNYFVAVSNIKPPDEAVVRHGYEKVLRARLADAMFFFEEDRKTPLSAKVERLKGIVFHDKLGTMYQKVERLKQLSPFVADFINADKRKAERAAFLSKADLVTEMVKEFTELQGVMGKNYALLDGEDKEVAEAIFEQYLPRFSDDTLPETGAGISLSVAEKIDNLVGFFGAGLKPTGSMDPFALRRNAIGLVRILVEKGVFLNLWELLKESFNLYSSQGMSLNENFAINDVLEFIKDRFKGLLSDRFSHDTIDAVVGATDNLADALKRIEAIEQLRKEEGFEEVLLTMRRVMNIIPEGFNPVDIGSVDNRYEKQLLESFTEVKAEIERSIEDRNYKDALLAVKKLKDSVDAFFDNVMVMDKDEEVRNRRLSILKEISETISQIADFRKIRG